MRYAREMLTTRSRHRARPTRRPTRRPLFTLALGLTLASIALVGADASADVAPPAHLKRVSSRVVLTGVAKAKGYTLVLAELTGPSSPGCRLVSEGKPLSKISYRWFSVHVLAVKGKLDKLDKETCKKLVTDKSSPRSKRLSITSTIAKKIPAASVHTVYAVQGVSGGEVKLAKPKTRYLDASGKELTKKQLQSSCAVGGSGRPDGLALVLLLGLGLALRRSR